MSFPVVNLAIIFLILGNLAASLSDVAVKLLNGEVSA
ncbi:EamA family transporter, partial [Vibrio anguillarum]|nr:EamA family transporter [Vibrio anguillarum]